MFIRPRGMIVRANQRSTQEKRIPPHITLPRPDEFGLPAAFDILEYQEDEDAIAKRLDRESSWGSLILAFSLSVTGVSMLSQHEGTPFWSNMLGALFPTLLGSAGIKWVFEKMPHLRRRNPIAPAVDNYRQALLATKAAIDDWNDRQLETGLTYWREQRGVGFEQALKAFLERRGCSVSTTKGSGDGGIDLVVIVEGKTFWCQCKGHAAPVGVAAVREIAGVCSRGAGKPVLVAVNGFTKAAVLTAKDLGVLLIDTPDLVVMAGKSQIMGVG